jgi:D-serine deaminase-like pyridoxal phosphate-dependent protein
MAMAPLHFLGAPLKEIDTPALLIDLDLMERNLRTLADFMAAGTSTLRPHAKTHKCPEVARLQLAHGARGITCAKLGEAEALVEGGINDILIANQIVGSIKIKRLMDLAQRADISVAVDSIDNAQAISEAAAARGLRVGVMVETNIGQNRCGLATTEDVLRLSQQVAELPGLRFLGLMGYEGHTVLLPNRAERESQCRKAMGLLMENVQAVEEAGIPVNVVSAGGTGTYNITARYPGITELQAGSYVFSDARYRQVMPDFECALTLLATVISRPAHSRVIVDAGRKAISDDFGLPLSKDHPELIMAGLSEEHGALEARHGSALKVGDKIELLPSHGCTTVNLHDWFYCHRNGRIEAIWRIAGRGKFQ